MDFTAIDVETANANLASICQIGIVRFQGGTMVDTWQSLIDPKDYFDAINVSIHGIDETAVAGAPTFPEVCDVLGSHLTGTVVVSHTAYDRAAVAAAFAKHRLGQPESTWLDSAKVARRTWLEISQRGYGLADVAAKLGIVFRHHDALEDARAAGEILVQAIRTTGMTLVEWLERVRRPIGASAGGTSERITREGNPEGPLFGEVLVFTGTLSMVRRDAADLAATAGCEVAPAVTKSTTLVVVGDQDISRTGGHEKTVKHRRAEELIAKGQPIRILGETDFQLLVRGGR